MGDLLDWLVAARQRTLYPLDPQPLNFRRHAASQVFTKKTGQRAPRNGRLVCQFVDREPILQVFVDLSQHALERYVIHRVEVG